MTERFYVTTPIYYINDVPHLGSAYTTIAADVLCRYHRVRGREGHLLTGTDEHGLKIQRAAEERGLEPQALADQMSVLFREAWPQLDCRYDDFIRTSEGRHQRAVQKLWRSIRDAGDIYLGHYERLYCVGCEAYFTEKELEQPGNRCPIHGTEVEPVREASYFFRLSKYGDRLLAHYQQHPEFVMPASRLNEVKSFVRSGLQDLSVSRTTFRWGVPVPDDPDHVMYVWFDALTNYWSALHEPEDRRRFWPPTVQLVGKDILRFHAVYWPAFLMAAGMSDAELPRTVFAHGFLSYGGRKMSKSLRNTISPMELAQALSPTVGVDALRYGLMRAISFGHDGDFSIDDLLKRYDAELGNTLGNLLHRVLPFAPAALSEAEPGPLEQELRKQMERAAELAAQAFEARAPTRALEAIWAGLIAANSYVDKAAPWTAKKEQPERLGTIVTTMVEALEAASVMIAPVMPAVARGMRQQLGLDPLAEQLDVDQWPLSMPRRAAGGRLEPGKPLFPRLDKQRKASLLERFSAPAEGASDEAGAGPKAAQAAEEEPEQRPTITYDDFAKLDLRIGVITEAARVKRKDRLLELRVDVGEPSPRRLVAGIAQAYAPEQLVGRRIVVLCNLAPRKFAKKLVSEGMLLAAEDDGSILLLGVDGEPAAGSCIR